MSGAAQSASRATARIDVEVLDRIVIGDPFILALFDPTAYATAFPDCNLAAADLNSDAVVKYFDSDPFVD